MEARAGELVVIEGGRAAGKTSLLEIAGARRRPDSGTIRIAGHDVTALQRGSLPFVRRNVGYVEPVPQFLNGATVLENVMLPLAARAEALALARDAALRALGKVGMVGAATAAPGTLSTSARRLVGIARALAGSPPLLVIDDPSGSLTAADTGAVLSALLGAIEHGTTVVCATGDGAFGAAAARAGARRLRLEAGCLLGGPTPLTLLSAGRGANEAAEGPFARATGRQGVVP
jgi:ABC-type ATPase involved in cell division